MKDIVYIFEKRNILSEDGRSYTTYGILCTQEGRSVERIEDISTDRVWVERAASVFNTLQLRPVRFRTAIRTLLSLGDDILEDIGLSDASIRQGCGHTECHLSREF